MLEKIKVAFVLAGLPIMGWLLLRQNIPISPMEVSNAIAPEWVCWRGDRILVSIYTITNLSIAISYLLISSILYYTILKHFIHRSIRNVLLGFAVFISMCGLSHFFDVVNIYDNHFYLGGIIKICAAITSGYVSITFFLFFKNVLASPDTVTYLQTAYSTMVKKVDRQEILQEDIDEVQIKLNECNIIIKEMNDVMKRSSRLSRNTKVESHPNSVEHE